MSDIVLVFETDSLSLAVVCFLFSRTLQRRFYFLEEVSPILQPLKQSKTERLSVMYEDSHSTTSACLIADGKCPEVGGKSGKGFLGSFMLSTPSELC